MKHFLFAPRRMCNNMKWSTLLTILTTLLISAIRVKNWLTPRICGLESKVPSQNVFRLVHWLKSSSFHIIKCHAFEDDCTKRALSWTFCPSPLMEINSSYACWRTYLPNSFIVEFLDWMVVVLVACEAALDLTIVLCNDSKDA